jgi:selenocysteine lyase/cysteine desulfurase
MVKAYFNYAGLSQVTEETDRAARSSEERFKRLLFSEAGVDEYQAQIIRTRKSISRVLDLEERVSAVFLLPNATTGLSLILRTFLQRLESGQSVATSDQEHPAIERILDSAEKRGVRVNRIGAVSEDQFLEVLKSCCIRERPAFVVVSHVSYKDGRVLPIERIARLLKSEDVPLIIDGTQAIGQIGFELPWSSYAAYVFSGHKWLFGPMGTGVIVLNFELFASRERSVLEVLQDMQSGTLSYYSMAALQAACEQTAATFQKRVRRLREIKGRVQAALARMTCLQLPKWSGPFAPGIATFLLPPYLPAWELANRVFAQGVAIKPFLKQECLNAIRISWSSATTDTEIELLAEALDVEITLLARDLDVELRR